MKEEIIEGNKLIAEFMGWVKSPYSNLPNKVYSPDLSEGKHIECFKYFQSWDELMPVVEKIESLDFGFAIVQKNHILISKNFEKFRNETYVDIYEEKLSKIQATWKAIIEFIKWYNTQVK